MPPGSQEPSEPLAEAPEEQSLMASVNSGEGEDVSAAEPKVKPARRQVFFYSWALDILLFLRKKDPNRCASTVLFIF